MKYKEISVEEIEVLLDAANTKIAISEYLFRVPLEVKQHLTNSELEAKVLLSKYNWTDKNWENLKSVKVVDVLSIVNDIRQKEGLVEVESL